MDDLVKWSEVVRNFGIVIGGAVGLAIAGWRGLAAIRQARAQAEQATIGRRQHITELFSQAVGLLADEKLEVRLGAIYMLNRIMLDFPDFADPVFKVLHAYVRERSGGRPEQDVPADVGIVSELLREQMRGRTS